MVDVSPILLYFLICLLWRISPISCVDRTLPNWPPHIPVVLANYDNWGNGISIPDTWIATPKDENDIVTIANWATLNSYMLNPSGHEHNWSPFTVKQENTQNVVVVDTVINFNKIQQPSQISASKYMVTVQPGATMHQLLTFLENATPSLGVYACPTPGELTVGGVIAIGGHGKKIPIVGETTPASSIVHVCETLNNFIISFKVVVLDKQAGKYVIKTFQRTDDEAKVFFVDLSRIFITEVTLTVGLNYNLRCVSRTDLSSKQLFAPVPGPNTLSSFLDESGRVQTITFPFTTNPWLKVWTIQPQKPMSSRKVTEPYNYPFFDDFTDHVYDLMKKLIDGDWALTPQLGQTLLTEMKAGLLTASDLWGPSKNLLLYVKYMALRQTTNDYVVLTTRPNIQKVLNSFVSYYDYLVEEFQAQGYFPFNGPMEIWITSHDEPDLVPNEKPPINGHPEYTVAIWFDLHSLPTSKRLNAAMTKIEEYIFKEYDGTYATVRSEWSKRWSYTNNSAWANVDVYHNINPSTFPKTQSGGLDLAVATADSTNSMKADIFTNIILLIGLLAFLN